MATIIADILSEKRVACRNNASSKKRALEWLSEMIADDCQDLTRAEIFDSFFARERLGSTGLGHGVAIPHGRLKSLSRPVGAFLHLKKGVDYDALDGQPVSLIFALLVPEDSSSEHLEILSLLAELLSNENVCRQLREAHDEQEILAVFSGWRSAGMGQVAGEH